MFLKQIVTTCLCSLGLFFAYSQEAITADYKLSLAPASPEAAMLFKFTDIPVSKYTGVPQISVPIKKIAGAGKGLDISLNYHASGNRVMDVPSYVGLGWSLQAGGSISRKVKGLPDDTDRGRGFLKIRQTYTHAQLVSATHLNYRDMAIGCLDAEPDEFYFNVNGYSGKFSFDWSTATNIQVSCNVPVKIAYRQETANSQSITSWTITTPDGYTYSFQGGEQTTNRTSFTGLGTCQTTTPYTTTWVVNRISSNNNPQEYMTLTYEGYTMGFDWLATESKVFGSGDNSCGCPGVEGDQSTWVQNRSDVAGSRIRQIKSFPGNITVDFISVNQRQDIAKISPLYNTNNKTLDTIRISANGKVTEQRVLEYFYQGDRLMLKRVRKVSITGSEDEAYDFAYNAQLLPSRESYAVDFWGFANGSNNYTLLPSFVNMGFYGNYIFRGADRSPNPDVAKAQILEKIVYPTGGSTEFKYEGHDYGFVGMNTVNSQGQYELVPYNANVSVYGDSLAASTWKSKSLDFEIVGTTSSDIKVVELNFSSATYGCREGDGVFCGGGMFLPRGSLSSLNPQTNQYETIRSYTHPGSASNGGYTQITNEALRPGKYRIAASVSRSPLNPPGAFDNMMVAVHWEQSDLTKPIRQKTAGGLRVKEIRHYDNINASPSITTYQYTMPNSTLSSGVINGEPIYFDYGQIAGNCANQGVVCGIATLIGSSMVVFGETNGSHIGYREVTAIEPGNGKTVSKFWSAFESPDIINYEKPFGSPTSNEHRTGLVYNESIYNQAGNLVKRDSFEYAFSSKDIGTIKVQDLMPHRGDTSNYVLDRYKVWYEPIRIGFSQVTKQVTWQDGVQLNRTIGYDNQLQLTKREVQSSGVVPYDSTIMLYRHPGDEGSMSGLTTEQSAAITKLKEQYRLQTVLEKLQYLNAAPVSVNRFNYKIFSNGQVQMHTIMENTGTASLETKFQIHRYDRYGNVAEQQKTGDRKYVYLYDYQASLINAQAINADSADIAFTSFEAESSGNWTIGSALRHTSAALTGDISYNMASGGITKSGLVSGRKYIVSYWSRNGVCSVAGGTAVQRTGRTVNGWTLYEHIITTSGTSISVTGTAIIDELRLYPATAEMSTFTYKPLIGVTSECDKNNRILYYEYDALGRLQLVRDQDRNIIKTFNYTLKN